MTTIVARGNTMAADGKVTAGDTDNGDPGYVVALNDVKIWKCPDGSLCGAAHTADQCDSFRRATEAGKDPPTLDNCEGLMLKPDGSLYHYEGTVWKKLDRKDFPFYAIGTGGRFALAAMKASADALRACQIAVEMDPWSGGVVSLLTIETKPNK